MKVAHLVTYDKYGAGRAALWISKAFMQNGMEPIIAVANLSDSNACLNLNEKTINLLKYKIYGVLNRRTNAKYVQMWYFHVNELGRTYSDPLICSTDVIHIHWINDGIWSVKFANYLKKLGKTIVVTLHDMWSFTGGCHFDKSGVDLGYEVLRDMYTICKCDALICGKSQVSIASIIKKKADKDKFEMIEVIDKGPYGKEKQKEVNKYLKKVKL